MEEQLNNWEKLSPHEHSNGISMCRSLVHVSTLVKTQPKSVFFIRLAYRRWEQKGLEKVMVRPASEKGL